MRPASRSPRLILAWLLAFAACETEIVELRRPPVPPVDAALTDAASGDASTPRGCACLLPCDSPDLCRDGPCTIELVCDEPAPVACAAANPCVDEGTECRDLDAPTQLCAE